MKKVYLCGHTGSINRGCEAIVRSTVKVLGGRNGDKFLATFAPWQDREMARSIGINLLPYGKYPTSLHRYFCAGMKKINKKSVAGQGIIQAPLFSRLKKGDLCLNIGGDTYCYGRPIPSIALNRYTTKKGIDNVLWCCSVEKDNIKGEILEDLQKYKYIFAREQLTYDALIEKGIDKKRVVKCCDPAFFLDKQEVELPLGFVENNTVGINVSEMTINSENPYAYSNVLAMIRYILEQTDMSVCLIPHVYSIKENRNDYPILKQIYEELHSNRVSIVDKEYNCEQLKYIISKCRFFVGARTHSTIAAYSTYVPTLVIGYSVKSKGIAIDLFGEYDGYVISYKNLTDKNELLENFKRIVENETAIRSRLESFVPEYKKQLENAIKCLELDEKIEKPFSICEKELCSGCSACAQKCPMKAITMKVDEEGFLHPEIDYSKCTNCGLCRKICPVANKPKDTNERPVAFAAIHKNEEIRKNSSSGGLFTALATHIIENGGVVFGAGFGENLKVVHKFTETLEGLEELRRSKYVQSEIGNCYIQAENFLKDGRKVLFVGTSCQIGGLLAYLGKSYDNLYTVDFICHGVPSPKVWERFVQEKEKELGASAIEVSFRCKKEGWSSFYMSIKFEDTEEYFGKITEDEYLRGFITDIYLRPSCYMCSFKHMHRQSDITLADFWDRKNTGARFDDDKGISLVSIHTHKGTNLLREISETIELEEVLYKDAIENNVSYFRSSNQSIMRADFFEDFKKGHSVSKLVNKYCGTGLASKLRRKAIQKTRIRK